MDEVQDPTLGEEIERLHAEHHRYAQRLEELIHHEPEPRADEQAELYPEMARLIDVHDTVD